MSDDCWDVPGIQSITSFSLRSERLKRKLKERQLLVRVLADPSEGSDIRCANRLGSCRHGAPSGSCAASGRPQTQAAEGSQIARATHIRIILLLSELRDK